jgi:hypothetical protein
MFGAIGRSSGSPAFSGPSRSVLEQWQLEIECPEKPIVITMQDHSYGDSSGFTPDSLLIHHQVKPNAAQTYTMSSKSPKRKIDSILPQIQNCSVETSIPADSILLRKLRQLCPKPTQ